MSRPKIGLVCVALLALSLSAHAEDRHSKCGGCGHRGTHERSAASIARHNMYHTFHQQILDGWTPDPVSGWSGADQFMGDVENAQIDGKLSMHQVEKLEKEFQDKYQGGSSQGLQGGSGNFSGSSGAVGSNDIGGIP